MTLKELLGRHVKGLGVGGKFVKHPYYEEKLSQLLNCIPYPGTFNVETNIDWRELASRCKPIVIPPTVWNGVELGSVYVWRGKACVNSTCIPVLVIRPLKSRHHSKVLELVSCSVLKDKLGSQVVQLIIECSDEPPFIRASGPRLYEKLA